MKVDSEKLQKLITPIEYGWREMSTDEYHNDKSAVNYSALKYMDKSEHAFAMAYWGDKKEANKAMKFGSIAHMAVLEGEKFKARYQVMPEFVGKTKTGEITTSKNSTDVKLQIAEWTAKLPQGSVIVTQEEQEDLLQAIESILSIDDAVKILQKGKPEVIGYWTDEETGINCRMMNDVLTFNFKVWLDFKTTQDSDWAMFRKSVENLHYDLQVAMYFEGIKNITGVEPQALYWLAAELKPPYEAKLHEISPIYLEIGRMKYRKYMRELRAAIDSKNFARRGNIVEMGEPSVYYKQKYEFNEGMI